MSGRDVGGMGESTLSAWAFQHGAIVNKAEYDRGGWDFLLEWSSPHQGPMLPLDRRPGPFQCLIQVKSTDSTIGRRSVKLWNWMRFTTSPLPSFFLVLEFAGMAVCQRAFLRHHWRKDMEATLRRVRELDAEGRSDLSGRTRSLSWADEDRFEPRSQELFSALERHIGQDLTGYSAKKGTMLRTLGYEEHGLWGTVNIVPPEAYRNPSGPDLLTDIRLGLVPEVETLGATFWDERFGLRSSAPTKEVNTRGIIRGPEGKSGKLRLSCADLEICLPSRTFVAAETMEELEIRRTKARIQISFASIVYDFARNLAALRFELPAHDEPRSAREFSEWGRLITFLDELADRPPTERLVRVRVEDFRIGALEFEQMDFPKTWLDVAETGQKLWHLLKRADAEHRAEITLDLLMHQRKSIQLTGHLTSGGVPDGRVSFPLETAVEEFELPEGDVMVPMLHWFHTLKALVVFPVLHYGTAHLEEEQGGPQLTVVVEHSVVKDPLVFDVDEWPSPDRWTAVLERCAVQQSGSAQLVAWWREDFGTGPPEPLEDRATDA